MLKFSCNGDNFEIKFYHAQTVENTQKTFTFFGVPKKLYEHMPHRGATFCLLSRNGKAFGFSFAFCSPKDNFSKAIGRKLSLARLLREANIPIFNVKAFRTALWKKYFERNTKPWSFEYSFATTPKNLKIFKIRLA